MLTTERLSIRPIRVDDWKTIQAIWIDQAKSVYAQYIKPKPLDDQSVFREIEKWASFAGSNEHQYLAICFERTVIGYVTLHQRENGYEIGYCFHSAYQGKGYAKESISALLDYMRAHGISCIMAQTALKNAPSVKLLLSLGFRQTRIEKVSFFQDAEGKDIVFDDGVFEMHRQ